MSVLDRIFGGGDDKTTERGASTTIIRDDEGQTISRDRSTKDRGTERTTGSGNRNLSGTNTETRESEGRRERHQSQTGVTNEQRRNRGLTQDNTRQRGRDDRSSSRTGQRQDTTALDRLLNTFRTGDTKGQERGSNLVDNLVRSGTVVENLDQASRDSLATLLQDFTGEDGGLSEFVGLLETRVGQSQARIAEKNADILAAAEQQGTRDIAATHTRLASAAGGSTQNSLVEATAAELRNDLQLNLAGLEAQLDQQARAEEREEIDQVLRGFGVQGTVAQQIGNTLAQGRQESTGFERGHETLTSLVDSITSTREDTRAREEALTNLTSLSQEQLLDTIQSVRDQNARRTTDNVLFGETTEQQQTVENQFLSDLINAISNNQQQEVSNHDIATVIDRFLQEKSDEALLREQRSVEATDMERNRETDKGFSIRDAFDWISDLGRRAAG